MVRTRGDAADENLRREAHVVRSHSRMEPSHEHENTPPDADTEKSITC